MDGKEIFVITLFILLVGIFVGLALGVKATNSKNTFCPECGRQYRDAVYCEYCGTELKEIQK